MKPDLALLVLRLAGLGLALAHGWGKVLALTSGETRFVEAVAKLGFPYPTFFAWASALAELVGGLCVALGLATRAAAALACVNMCVAAFLRHHAHQQLLAKLGLVSLSEETLKSWGNPELALVYLVILLAVLLLGPGRFSVDGARRRGKGGR